MLTHKGENTDAFFEISCNQLILWLGGMIMIGGIVLLCLYVSYLLFLLMKIKHTSFWIRLQTKRKFGKHVLDLLDFVDSKNKKYSENEIERFQEWYIYGKKNSV